MTAQLPTQDLLLAIEAATNPTPTHLRAICYGMKAPEDTFPATLDGYMTASFDSHSRCENRYDIATNNKSLSLNLFQFPGCNAPDSEVTFEVDTYRQFTALLNERPVKSIGGSCTVLFKEPVHGLGCVVQKIKMYNVIWHLIQACTSCQWKEVRTVGQYKTRLGVLQTLVGNLRKYRDNIGGLRIEATLFVTVRYMLCVYRSCIHAWL